VRRVSGVLVWLAAAAVAAQPAPAELFEDGVAAFEAGLYEAAARNFRTLLSSAPGAQEAVPASFLEALSRFYAARGAADAEAAAGAAERFAAHQRQFPDSPYGDQIWYWIGAARLAAGDAEGALSALQQHLSQPEADSRRYPLLAREAEARALEQLGRGAEALDRYESLLAAADTSPDPAASARWLERSGMLLLTQGRYVAATERFRRIFADHPQTPQAQEALFFVAEAQYFAQELPAATEGYRRYLEFFPDAAHRRTASYRLARLRLDAGDLAGARQLVEVLAADPPATGASGVPGATPGPGDDPAAVALLSGDVSAAGGDWRAAVTAYDGGLALAVAPHQRQVLAMNLALAQVETGVPLQAIVNFEEAAAGPDSAIGESALYNRALLLVGEGQLAAAAAALEQFLERFPDSEHRPAVEGLLLDVQERAGDHRGLLETLDRMAARRRLTPQEQQRRGTALLWLGDDITALETLARSGEELPPAARAESQYRIGAVYARRGEYARAAPFFSAALTESGNNDELRQRAGYSLAVTHFNTGDYALALALLEEVTDTAAGRWLAAGRFARAATLYRLGRAREAAEYFGLAAAAYAVPIPPDRSLEDAGAAAAALSWQALALFRGGDWEGARTLSRELAMEAAAEPGLHWYRAGLASALLEDLTAAEEELLAALEAVPGGDSLRPAIHYELARLHLAAGDPEAAGGWLQRLERAYPDHRLTAIGRLRRADTLRDLGRLREAADAYRSSAAHAGGQPEDWAPGMAELARYSALGVLEELADVPAMLEAAWSYLLHHPSGTRAEQVAARLRAALVAAAPELAQDYYRRASSPATDAAEVPPAVAAPIRLAYAELLLGRDDPAAAERVLREQLEAPSSEEVRSAALLLLGRAYEAGQRWPDAASLYRGLALAEQVEVAGHGALGLARVLARSGDAAAAAEEYGAVAVRFAEQPEVAGEAWFRGALAHREARNQEAAALFVRRLRERFPASSWARRAAEEFPSS
jgi:TolA-binding protein